MKDALFFIFAGGVIQLSSPVWAAPLLSSQCPQAQQIRSPRNSGGFIMGSDCTTAYVLPPEDGSVKIVAATPVADMASCDQVQVFQNSLLKIDEQINDALKSKGQDNELKSLFATRKQFLDSYGNGKFVNQEALDLNLQFNMEIEKNVQKYRDWNQELGIMFRPISIKDATLNWSAKESSSPDFPVVLNNYVAVNPNGSVGAGSFNALVRLPLSTACQLRDPFTNTISKYLGYEKVGGTLAASMTYDYELQSSYTYKATYNLSALAQEIKSNATSGGFFSSSSTSELIQRQSDDSWFSLEVACDDSRVCDQVRLDKAIEIKSRLVKQVLDEIALFKGGYFNPGGAEDPGPDGAARASEGLKKCANVYCQAGAVVLDVLDATFGGKSKTDNYISTHTGSQHEEVTEKIPVSFSGNLGFGG